MTASHDTIYAFATPAGRSGIAVLRVSGPAASSLLETCVPGPRPEPRRATIRVLSEPRTGEAIDQALVLWMPGPASFTGEDVVEFHLHGGVAVRQAALRVCGSLPDFRPAEAGEFVRRAFLAGRLDLSEIEGLADLIDAETEAQRRQALRQAGGSLRKVLDGWRERLLDAAALVEASIDFADEDLPDDVVADCARCLAAVASEMTEALVVASSGEVVRDGLTVVLVGPPNSGKSTLLNRIARREVAIVSPVAGTTRDLVEARCDLGGYLVTFVDTAGMRETSDPVERVGVERARRAARSADLVLALVAADTGQEATMAVTESPVRRLWTKTDLPGVPSIPAGFLAISAETGAGIDALLGEVKEFAERQGGRTDALLTREHQHYAVREAELALSRAISALGQGQDVLASEDIRLALRAIGTVTGKVGAEDVLDRVFGRFCIGK